MKSSKTDGKGERANRPPDVPELRYYAEYIPRPYFFMTVKVKMMRTVIVILMLLFTANFLLGQTTSKRPDEKSKVEEELKNLERQWEQALTNRDVGVLDRLMAEDYLLTTVSGEVVNKATVLEQVKTVNAQAKVQNTDTAVRVYGSTAVVTGLVLISGRFNNQDLTTQSRYLKVYVKRRGRWQVVAAQATLVAQK